MNSHNYDYIKRSLTIVGLKYLSDVPLPKEQEENKKYFSKIYVKDII